MLHLHSAGAAVPDFSGYTLVLPSLSLGNVDQLALDLLVNSLGTKVERAGHFATPLVAPVVGPAPFAEGSIAAHVSTSLELYTVPEARVAVLQQRTGAAKNAHELLILHLLRWAAGAGFARVMVVGAADAAARPDALLGRAGGKPPLVFLTTDADPSSAAALAAAGALQWDAVGDAALELEAGAAGGGAGSGAEAAAAAAATPAAWQWEPCTPAATSRTARVFSSAWSTGYAPVYFRRALSGLGAGAACPPLSCVMIFAAEGDNRSDAAELAVMVARATGLAGLLGGGPAEGGGAAAAGGAAGGSGQSPQPSSVHGLKLREPAYWDRLFGPDVRELRLYA